MTDSLDIFDVSPPGSLTPAAFQEMLAAGSGRIAFCAGPEWGPENIIPWEDCPTEIVVTVSRPGACGRGPDDLLWRIWQESKTSAALLDDDLPSVGAVIFSESTRMAARELTAEAANPVTLATARAISRGTAFDSLVCPSAEQTPPEHPPLLLPDAPTAGQRELGEVIGRISAERLVPGATNKTAIEAVRAGLLLWHDLLDESHQISQSIEGHPAGDHWHAIMHRREGDFGNSKYWFRRAGHSPIYEELAERAAKCLGPDHRALAGGRWDPAAFVDSCQQTANSNDSQANLALRRVQADEMLLLLLHCFQEAQG